MGAIASWAVPRGELSTAAIMCGARSTCWLPPALLLGSHHTWAGVVRVICPLREGSPQGHLALAVLSPCRPKDAKTTGVSSKGKRREISAGKEPRLCLRPERGGTLDPTGAETGCAKNDVLREAEWCPHGDLWTPTGLSLARCWEVARCTGGFFRSGGRELLPSPAVRGTWNDPDRVGTAAHWGPGYAGWAPGSCLSCHVCRLGSDLPCCVSSLC